MWQAELQQTHHDTAPEPVLRHTPQRVAHELVNDELECHWTQYLDALLHDEIRMRGLHGIANVAAERVSEYHARLLICSLESLLKLPAPASLESHSPGLLELSCGRLAVRRARVTIAAGLLRCTCCCAPFKIGA
eukprot:CAMPEP_0115233696 /NCGR_PEP_ID=MMETSP0270-20121206/34410_1 /TAXON_ID=71861 /ORGANISM="Scrippsiella trochoidea, Strain CCMP3099" /LENGTH=133 /DNA_ID=CAMNT_0002648419 /DNA_START=640 /DNA_END=1041 /DNA_ORIENTATION=+